LEFWNLVFPQYDRQPDGSLPPLAQPAIDTGMGLERMAAILQGRDSIFESDLMAPLVEFAADAVEPRVASRRIVADHLRAMTFLIGEGVTPGNEGRGYVLRRIIRRAVLHARQSRMARPVSEGTRLVVDLMRGQYPELAARAREIEEAVGAESTRFDRTLEQGMELFEALAARHGEVIPGEAAFMLHDTYGFPIDLTRELAEERSLTVDMEGFRNAMSAQKERSRSTFRSRWEELRDAPRTEFVGYTRLAAPAVVAALRVGGVQVQEAREGDEVEVFLDRTPFYAEAGGQVGDTGWITGPDGRVRVDDAQRPGEDVTAHLGSVAVGLVRVGQAVQAEVDAGRRRDIARHHTATHLLHRALREVLGEGVVQRGSWVGPDHATFDIPLDRPVSPEEMERVGRRVNEQVRAALHFHESHRSYQEAVAAGAMHLFEEKYGDVVRVVCFGDWTCELCGGTHVESSADAGPVVILSESSVGAGLRRIDLVAGERAERLLGRRLADMAEMARSLGGSPDDVRPRVEEMRAELKRSRREIERLAGELRAARVRSGTAGGAGARPDLAVLDNGVPLMVVQVEADGMEDLREYADRYFETMERPGVLVAASPGISAYVVKVARELAPGLDANRLRPALGPGGGRPALVQGKLAGAVPGAAELAALLG
ncbi:MAG: alanine--tRNA ligase, partial [Candidatus Dormibacterales bacterium]